MDVLMERVGSAGQSAPLICLVASEREPLELIPDLRSSLVVVGVQDWCADLTPWPAGPLGMGGTCYDGLAEQTLARLVDEVIPAVEESLKIAPTRRAICGYSLAGLFSLWAFCSSGAFDDAASVSGSLWYPGWCDWLGERRIEGAGRRAFLSLGGKESRVHDPVVSTVANATGQTLGILRANRVECAFERNPGGHFHDISGRIGRALSRLDKWAG